MNQANPERTSTSDKVWISVSWSLLALSAALLLGQFHLEHTPPYLFPYILLGVAVPSALALVFFLFSDGSAFDIRRAFAKGNCALSIYSLICTMVYYRFQGPVYDIILACLSFTYLIGVSLYARRVKKIIGPGENEAQVGIALVKGITQFLHDFEPRIRSSTLKELRKRLRRLGKQADRASKAYEFYRGSHETSSKLADLYKTFSQELTNLDKRFKTTRETPPDGVKAMELKLEMTRTLHALNEQSIETTYEILDILQSGNAHNVDDTHSGM